MPDRENVITALQKEIDEAAYPDRPRKFMMPLELAEHAIALLKAQGEEIEELKQEIEGHKDNLRETLNEMMRYADELKAREPRVMTLEEVRELQDGVTVWLEDNDKADVIPAIVNHVWNSLPNIVSFSLKNMREVKADILWYGIKWRCWTSRPTAEQMEATPWNL